MAQPILTTAASVLCSHGGTATPLAVAVSKRVRIAGAAAVTTLTAHTISGCALPPPPTANGPCVSGLWLQGATRVRIEGTPAALISNNSVCFPPGTPLIATSAQTKVVAT